MGEQGGKQGSGLLSQLGRRPSVSARAGSVGAPGLELVPTGAGRRRGQQGARLERCRLSPA
eukprot:3410822-Lingulodinium_polyedra.AAC.1